MSSVVSVKNSGIACIAMPMLNGSLQFNVGVPLND